MPSTDRSRVLSRRQLVAVCGACAGGGSLAGYAYGAGIRRSGDCDPSPLDTSPTDWPLPNYDAANARAPPPESAPAPELTERWRISHQQPAHPLVINGSVVVASEARSPASITAYGLRSGEQRWTKPVSVSPYTFTLAAGGDSLFLSSARTDDGTVSRALSTADGSERWTSDVSGTHVLPFLEDGHLLFRDGSEFIAVDARTGEECRRLSVDRRIPPGTAATNSDGTVFVNIGTDGDVIALDEETGEVQWEADISAHFHPNEDDINDAIRGPIVAGSDRIVFHTFGGLLIALDAETGDTDWVTPDSHPEISVHDGRRYAPPELEPIARADDTVIVIESDPTDRSDRLHAIDSATGDARWTFEPEADEGASIWTGSVAGETVFFPVRDELFLVDLADGSVIETHDLEGAGHSLVLASRVCLVATFDGVVAFEEA